MIRSLRPWLTRLYPRAWRLRYEQEFTALLEQCLHSPLDVLDILLGALDAHLLLFSGEPLNWRDMNKVNKIRTAVLIVFAAYIGFVIAGFALVGMADDSPMIALTKTSPALSIAWTSIQVCAALALLAIVIGGMPIALTVIRRALSGSHSGLAWLMVPVVSCLFFLIYLGLVAAVGLGKIHLQGVVPVVQPGTFPSGNRLLLGGLMLTFILGAIASTLAVWKVVSRTEVEQETFRAVGRDLTVRIYRFAFWPAVATTLAMLLMLVGTLIWGVLAFTAIPGSFTASMGPWGTSTQAWFIGIILLMVFSTLAALMGVLRSREKQEQS